MKRIINKYLLGNTPFCIIQKQDSEDLIVLEGNASKHDLIKDIPRKASPTKGSIKYDTISVIPFCQIKERGYHAHDNGEKIRTIEVTKQQTIVVDDLLLSLKEQDVEFTQQIQYDTSTTEYEKTIQNIVKNEIGNGEGANFVIPRNGSGQIGSFNTAKAFSIFKSLLESDYGTYWKFIYYDTDLFFIGSTPERHLFVKDGRVKMNPISGTFRKDKEWNKRAHFKDDLLVFLKDQKEINELFMVVDEELKMMAKMCEQGGTIVGPLLKEMSQLIHSEYLLAGTSDKDIFDLFIDSMYAATVVGSPVENACKIIKKYTSKSRRYYGSAMMLAGRDENGKDFLDSPITIRTAEIDTRGNFNFSVGATLVKDSVASEELKETEAKGKALLSCLSGKKTEKIKQLLPKLYNDDDIAETLVQRNQNLSNFWFFKQDRAKLSRDVAAKTRITIIHNEDDFVYMISHILSSIGFSTSIVRYHDYEIEKDDSDITLLGPGPGDPTDLTSPKIVKIRQIATSLIERQKKSIFICLGHQILCSVLGYEIMKKAQPLQGSQIHVNVFGRQELVGFYNTFVPKNSESYSDFQVSVIPEDEELIAIRGEHFTGYQFHPESILTKNGFMILEETVQHLLSKNHVGPKAN